MGEAKYYEEKYYTLETLQLGILSDTTIEQQLFLIRNPSMHPMYYIECYVNGLVSLVHTPTYIKNIC